MENRNPFAQNQSPEMHGEQYWKDQNELAWADDAEERYNREHGIDLATGGITGSLGLIPHSIAQQWQAAHDQAVWNARNRMGREALRMTQGAAGLMSSYRAGGSAALLSNVHGQMANMQMRRAEMMQPLDLLGDYRRELIHKAGSAGRSESAWGAGLAGLGAIASVAIPYVGPLVGAAMGAAGGYLGSEGVRKQNAAMAAATGAMGGGGGYYGGVQAQGGFDVGAAAKGIGQGIGALFGTGGQQQGQAPQGQAPGAPSGIDQSGKNAWGVPGGAQGQEAPGVQAQGAPGQQQGGEKSIGQGGQQQGQQGMGGMPGIVGQDGVFGPQAYAATGMGTSPAAPIAHRVLQMQMGERITQDPSWAMISMAWDRELQYRTTRVA